MRYAIMIPMWGRPKLTDYVFHYYNRLRSILAPEIELKLLAIGSEGMATKLIAERNGFDYIEYTNMPRNRKNNAGLQRAKLYDPDALFTIGSDDIITADYFKNINLEAEVAVGLIDFYFLDFPKKRLGYWGGFKEDWRKGEPIGTGRCYSKRILEKCRWQLWSQDIELKKSMDLNCRRRLASLGIKMKAFKMRDFGCFAVDIKTEHNLWAWDKYEYDEIIEDGKLNAILADFGMSDIFGLGNPDKSLEAIRYEMYSRGHQPHTPPGAVEVLKSGMNKDSRILETGAGMSTVWFAERAGGVVSFEHDEKWFRLVQEELLNRGLNNVRLHLDPDYPRKGLNELNGKFDIIFIDGRGRVKSILTSAKHLKSGGLMLLDDADRDRYTEAKEYLDDLGWPKTHFPSVIKAGKYATGWVRSDK